MSLPDASSSSIGDSKARRTRRGRLLGLTLCMLLPAPTLAATFVIDTTSDNVGLSACTAAAGDCSLRGAITRANAIADADDITFAIPTSEPGCNAVSGVCRIEVASSFSITRPLTVDGYSQPGALPNTIPAPGANNAQLKIEITSAGFVNLGVALFNLSNSNASPFSLRGLAMALPTSAIVTGGLRHDHRGNWFCVDAQGQSLEFDLPCSAFALTGFNRSIRVGGPDPADRNVIAGGGRDLGGLPGGGTNRLRVNSIVSERGLILLQGNLIGLAPDGITPLPMRDAFSVNNGDDAFDTPDIRILDNRFARAPRGFSGGFGGALQLSISRVMNEVTLVQGNVFGLAVDGSVVGVDKDHIEVFLGNSSRVPRLLIGGLGAAEGNRFAGALRQSFTGLSLGSAVILPSGNVSTFVEFVGNRMLGNQGIGLDFPTSTAGGGVAVGRTPNDAGDPDVGANLQQNFPKISAYSVTGAQFNITYRVDSDPANSSYPLRVDFYKALGDEGEVLLDSDVYASVNAQQDKSASLSIPPAVSLSNDDVIVAIATDAQGRSSEFSFDPLSLSVVDTPDPHPAGLPFLVNVTALATEGPFKPNGVVDVSLSTSPPITCSLTLAPTTTANTSSGSCQMIPTQAGPRSLTLSYRALQGAFGSATGQDVVITEPHVVSVAGPEQIGFARCRQNVLEGETAQIRVERPSGGVANVTVDFTHTPGSATPGDDYTVPPDQLLQWAPGDIAAKVIDVPIAGDGLPEGTERFRVNLGNVMGAAVLPFGQLDVEIVDGQTDQRFRNGFEGPECLP
jgi:hypothetical protein